MKKIIIITILSLFPLSAFASENWDLKDSKNTISIEGNCSQKDMKIEIYVAGKGEPVYTSNAACHDGKFYFNDDLLQWKNLNDGKYELVVNGDEKNIKAVEIQRPIQQAIIKPSTKTNDASVVKNVSVEKPLSPELKFLGSFVTLQQTILDMRSWLAQTNYPKLAKSMIGFSLDSLDSAIAKLSGTVMSSESIKEGIAVNATDITDKNTDNTDVPANSATNVKNNDSKNIEQVTVIDNKTTETASEVLPVN